MKKLIVLLLLIAGFVATQAHSQSSTPSSGTFSIADSISKVDTNSKTFRLSILK